MSRKIKKYKYNDKLQKDNEKHQAMTSKFESSMSNYPKTTRGNQCLTPCFLPGTDVLHPITLHHVTDRKSSFCAVAPWRDEYQNFMITDTCTKPTSISKSKTETDELRVNIGIPGINFNYIEFLKNYYHIYSFEHAILWYNEHLSVPYDTIKRIINASIAVFGLEYIDKEIDDIIADFFYYIIKNYWINYYFRHLDPLLDINTDGKVFYKKELTTDSSAHHDSEYDKKKKTEYILSHATTNFLKKTFKQYIIDHKDKWNDIYNHMNAIKKYMQEQLIKSFK